MKKKYVKIITIILIGLLLLIATCLSFLTKEKKEIPLVRADLEGIYYYENGDLQEDMNGGHQTI